MKELALPADATPYQLNRALFPHRIETTPIDGLTLTGGERKYKRWAVGFSTQQDPHALVAVVDTQLEQAGMLEEGDPRFSDHEAPMTAAVMYQKVYYSPDMLQRVVINYQDVPTEYGVPAYKGWTFIVERSASGPWIPAFEPRPISASGPAKRYRP